MTSPQMPTPPPGQPYGQFPQMMEAPKNGFGIASLILGIIGLFGSFFLIGAIPALIGLVLGIIGYRRVSAGTANNKGVAIAGILTSLLAILIVIAIGALVGVVISSEEFRDFTECLEAANNDQDAVQNCQVQFGEDPDGE